jgi:hypothetical protein
MVVVEQDNEKEKEQIDILALGRPTRVRNKRDVTIPIV